jgi:myosin-crossreactive antigen
MDKNWNLNSDCAVLNSDDLETDEEDPKFALENGLIYALGIHDVQDIVINAKEQNLNCTGEDLLQAFLFYYNIDAFIDFRNDLYNVVTCYWSRKHIPVGQ